MAGGDAVDKDKAEPPVNTQALSGIKVVGFAWQALGALVDRYLAHLGAEVIRIESSFRPDAQRAGPVYKDRTPGINRAGYYNNYNSGKYGITLNMKHPEAVKIAKKLVARADLVTDNFTGGVLESWGLGYDELIKIKSDIIMVRMGMMGNTGPQRKFRGHGMHLAALSGVGDLIGWPDRDPCGSPGAYTDYFGCHFGAIAVLGALSYRHRTGRGQYIDMAQRESTVYTVAVPMLDYTVNGRVLERMGNRSAYHAAAPHGSYRCLGNDRWCAIAVYSDEEWGSFCEVIGNPAWTKEPRFATLSDRRKNDVALDRNVEEWTTRFPPEDVMAKMQAHGIAAGVVKNGKDIHEDPQLEHRHHFSVQNHSEIGHYKCSSPSFKLSLTPAEVRMPAPCLGEHNEYVMTQVLGMSDEAFVRLMADGVFE